MTKSAKSYLFVTLLLLGAAAACGGDETAVSGGGGGGGRAGGMPAMGVEIVTLEAKPVEQTTEFVGTIKSRRSADIQPQVEGFITRIRVKSGDRVAEGAVLMDIDSRLQQANLSSLESVKAQREVDVTYARQEAQRAEKLLAAGAASQMDADRASNQLKASEAQLRTIEEQIRASHTDLGYYRVTAPASGVIGDIPVHEGDRVTKSTLLTTIDANAGLEVYLNVPVQQAPKLKLGLPVRLVDETGAPVANEKISFISPSVDTTTQTVLAKTLVTAPAGLRTDQYVRALVIWSNEPGLTVPLTAVVRINGQFFAFVAESAPQGGGLVAHQRAVQLGAMNGNSYVVRSGLKPGEKLIVSGIQKIGDGSPVRAASAAPAPPAASASQGAR